MWWRYKKLDLFVILLYCHHFPLKGENMRNIFCYVIILLALSSLVPATPQAFFFVISSIFPITPWAAEVEKRDETDLLTSVAEAERSVIIDPGTIYIGDDGGVGLVYEKEFMVRSVESTNTLSLRVAGMVAVRNDNESEDYNNGFYTNKLYINGRYIDNLNNYVYQEEDRTFRTIFVPLPADILRLGRNKLVVMAKGPKGGNHDDFALQAIKLVQW